jgi:hypothetical protein
MLNVSCEFLFSFFNPFFKYYLLSPYSYLLKKKGALPFEKTPHFHTKYLYPVRLVVFAFDKPGIVIEDKANIKPEEIVFQVISAGTISCIDS